MAKFRPATIADTKALPVKVFHHTDGRTGWTQGRVCPDTGSVGFIDRAATGGTSMVHTVKLRDLSVKA